MTKLIGVSAIAFESGANDNSPCGWIDENIVGMRKLHHTALTPLK